MVQSSADVGGNGNRYEFAAITVGRGLKRPQGEPLNITAAPLELLRIALEQHDGLEAWWSPGIFSDGKRSIANWRAQVVMAVDVDYEDELGQHVPPAEPLDLEGSPCTYAHTTPRGARLLFLLDKPIVDTSVYPRAWRELVDRVDRWLAEREALRFIVDKQCKDLARFYWTPRATVDGLAREAEIIPGSVPVTELSSLLFAPVIQLPIAARASGASGSSRHTPSAASAASRARAWLRKAEPAVSGQHGHDVAFRVIERVVRGFRLTDQEALDALSEWNASCSPPWSEAELRHKIADGRERGDTPLGSLLDAAPAPRETSGAVGDGPRIEYIEDRGQNAAIAENVARMLERDPVWRGGPRHDRYSLLTLWPSELPELIRGHVRLDREIVSTDYSALQAYAIREHKIRASREVVEQGARLAAERNAFDSLVTWVTSLPKWDGTPRLECWLPTYLGCEDTAFHRVTGRAWLRACVARAREPGLHVDMAPVLQGEQGAAKNRAIATLFAGGPGGAPWCVELGSWRPDHPDTKRLACSRWILHDDEFSARDPRQVDALKSWISRDVEQWTAKYSNDVTVMRRRALLVASVNAAKFLHDPTGARRWYVWRVGRIDVPALERDRLQLLAEASESLQDAPEWRDGLQGVADAQRELAEDATTEDGLVEQLRLLAAKGEWSRDGTAGSVLAMLLGVPPERQDKAWTTRLGLAVQAVPGHVSRRRDGGSEKIRFYYPIVR